MRETIGTTTIFKIIIVFTLLFAAFLTLALTYNRVYKVKNETISIIEKYEGLSNNTLKLVNNYLKNSNYSAKGTCANDEYGMISLDEVEYESARDGEKYYYCMKYSCYNQRCLVNGDNDIYYDIVLFFHFDLPVIGDLTTFRIKGETKKINLYSEEQKLK